jgi:HAD superfamily hydrolase (TIGR01459 family)
MTRLIRSLDDIAAGYDVLLCDLWGCLHNGRAPYPAAVAALERFRATGGRVVLMTNAPRPSKFVEVQLDRMGMPRGAWDLIVSSGDAAQYAMLSGAVGTRVWHLGPAKDDGFFTDLPADAPAAAIARVALEDAEGIVCTGPFDELTEAPEDYRARFLHAKTRGLKLLCANPDLVVDYGETRIYCAGALAALYDQMGGESLYFGKPHPPIYDLARRRLAALTGEAPDSAAMLAVGDGIATDIRGAIGEGIDALFVTGGLAADAFGADAENPDPDRLETWLAAERIAPVYAIGRLR